MPKNVAKSTKYASPWTGESWKAGKFGGTIPPPTLIEDKASAIDLRERLKRAEWVGVDTEFDEGQRLVTFQVSDGEVRAAIPADNLRYFKSWLLNENKKVVLHWAAADLPVFKKAGIELRGFIVDTAVLDWMVDENRRTHGLKSCVFDWLGIPMTDFKDTFGIVPEGKKRPVLPTMAEIVAGQHEKFIDYGTLDPYATYWLFRHHQKILMGLRTGDKDGSSLWDYYLKHEAEFTMTLHKMTQRGIAVDIGILQDIGKELRKTIARTRHVFIQYAPPISVTRSRLGQKFVETIPSNSINLRSPSQLSSLFYDALELKTVKKDKNGERDKTCKSTDVEHLTAWSTQGNVLADVVLDHRRAATMLGTFIGEEGEKGLLSHIVTENGLNGPYQLVRTSLFQTGTVTGRLASRDPNLQNIPARQDKDPYRIRRAFVAREGCSLVVADYSLFELRVMAHLSKDEVMCKALRAGHDLHSITAKRCFKLPCAVEEVKKLYPDRRNAGKAINFGLQYGMRAGLLAHQIGCSKEDAQRYIDAYFDLYTGVYYWMQKTVERCREFGFVRTVLGRMRRVPQINIEGDENYGLRKHAENQAMNAPIQGSVADIIKLAMNEVERDAFMQEHEAKLLLQVHDELIVESPKVDAHVVCNRLKEIMEGAYKLRVPMVVDAHVGQSWEEAKGA